eukprot:7751-Heterococcus_DN1.PRE.2
MQGVNLLRGASRTTRPMNRPVLMPYCPPLNALSKPAMTTTRKSSRGLFRVMETRHAEEQHGQFSTAMSPESARVAI